MTNPNDTASMAVAYVQRGWKVIQLHDVTAGACSCQLGQYCESPGKHPLVNAWQLSSLGTAPEVYAAWARNPRANLGIVTGPDSGIWVLDIDPKHDGHLALAALEMEHGALPKTYTARTGSGGMHFYFDLANVDFDLNNSTGGARESSKFPSGMDVRGRGGFVVAAPSISGYGPYGVLPDPDAMAQVSPLVSAPRWVVERQRPKPYIRPEIRPDAIFREGHSYALTAVRGELAMMAGAVPGTRNDVAFKVGCRLYELALADWAGLDFDMVQAAFLDACEQANVDGKFLYGEAWSVWLKAQRKVREPAVLPPATFHGTPMTGWTMPPGAVTSDFDQAGESPANPFSSPGTYQTLMNVAEKSINGPSEQPFVLDLFERAVEVELGKLLVREEATRRARARAVVVTDFDKVALDDAGMDSLPDTVQLVNGWLDMDSLARVNGPSGHGKSFVVLDIGACISTGMAWHGHPVHRTTVCYVVAEGARGMGTRAKAWCQRHGLDSTGITFVPRPVQIGGEEWESFKSWCVRRQFGLIIFDTQARNSLGSDENDATEMGLIVAGLDEVRQQTGGCALLVHHRGLRGDLGRGSTAVRGAMDVELDVSRQGTTVTLKSTKQKDRADPEPLRFTMNKLGESAVLIGEMEASMAGPFTSPEEIVATLRERCAIAIAQALLDAPGLTRSEAQTHARVGLSLGGDESTRRTVRRAWADLERLGRLAKMAGREAYFFVDLDGAPILQANPDKTVEGGPEVYVP